MLLTRMRVKIDAVSLYSCEKCYVSITPTTNELEAAKDYRLSEEMPPTTSLSKELLEWVSAPDTLCLAMHYNYLF